MLPHVMILLEGVRWEEKTGFLFISRTHMSAYYIKKVAITNR
jgi:hypothetical protein